MLCRLAKRPGRSHALAVFLLFLSVAFVHPVQGAQVELTEAQRTLLALQLKEHYKCELSKVLFARELEVGGHTLVEGRIRCTDQREVDFAQSAPHQKFELRLCQPTVC